MTTSSISKPHHAWHLSAGVNCQTVIAVSALQDGIITPNTTRNDPGYWRIPNTDTRPFRDWLRWGHGRVDIIKSLEDR